mmetsp:Transcript_9540/g.38940  ORF Transcript_9540/g.38940 Transcript_9540/m.38940 type:complete len:91 (-) Transcript_9540:177-449(-)
MRTYHTLKNRSFCPIVNVDMLWPMLPEGTLAKAAEDEDKAPVLDVTSKGFFKVCGKGSLPETPIVVKAKFFTKLAESKIKAAGGACILVP